METFIEREKELLQLNSDLDNRIISQANKPKPKKKSPRKKPMHGKNAKLKPIKTNHPEKCSKNINYDQSYLSFMMNIDGGANNQEKNNYDPTNKCRGDDGNGFHDENNNEKKCVDITNGKKHKEYSSKNFKNSPIHLSKIKNYTGDVGNMGNSKRNSKLERKCNNANDLISDPPITKKCISADGLIRFLKSKVTILEQELDANNKLNIEKNDELDKCIVAMKQLNQAKEQFFKKNELLVRQIQIVEERSANEKIILKERDEDIIQLKKSIELLEKDAKSLKHLNTTLESKLLKSQEDLEYTRKNCIAARAAEKELQTIIEKNKKINDAEVKTVRKQNVDLIAAYKKQLCLIDNLQRQNKLFEQGKLIDICEKEFLKILDWPNKRI